MRLLWVAVGITWMLAPVSAGADYLKYTDEDGTICFTDDAKRVPAKYKDQVERIPERDLESYGRLTIVPKAASFAPRMDVWAETLEAAAAQAEPMPGPAPRAYERHMLVPTGDGTSLEIAVDRGTIVIKRARGRWSEDGWYKPHTIVEQNGKVLADIEQY